ncbi:MAG TPA: hypothetical protein VK603_11305, partial [Candidatus Saccharimonadales bacterium]|nr:hypothetical protein [Candidatus Saccharimonadales bacterium]
MLIVIAVIELYSAFEHKFFTMRDGGTDLASWYQGRMEPMRRALPSRGFVGYFGEEKVAMDLEGSSARFYLAQYSLAPVVLVFNNDSLPLVIGNFHES